jgi:hypothetical protein
VRRTEVSRPTRQPRAGASAGSGSVGGLDGRPMLECFRPLSLSLRSQELQPRHPGGSPARRVNAEPARTAGKDSADRPTETLRCGCDVYPADLHDVDACLEALADELAYREELRSRVDRWNR